MKRLIFTALLLLSATPSWALGWGDIVRTWEVFNASDEGPTLPENCREEQVWGSLPAGIERSECSRYICSGNFWGDSAIDVCCGDETVTHRAAGGRIVYSRCKIRRPTVPESAEPWIDLKLPVAFEESDGTSGLLMDEWLLDPLIPMAFAQGPQITPWSQQEKYEVAGILSDTATAIHQAIRTDRVGEIGHLDIEFRAYAELAYAVAQWGAELLVLPELDHFLDLLQYHCLQGRPECCFQTVDMNFEWSDQTGLSAATAAANLILDVVHIFEYVEIAYAAATGGLSHVPGQLLQLAAVHVVEYTLSTENHLRMARELSIGQYPDRGGATAAVFAGLVFNYMVTTGSSVWGLIHTDAEPEFQALYTTVSTSWIISSIVHHFLPDPIRLATDQALYTEDLRAIYESLQDNADAATARLVAYGTSGNATPPSEASLPEMIQMSAPSNPGGLQVIEDEFVREGGLNGSLAELLESCAAGGTGTDTPLDNNHHVTDSGDSNSDCEGDPVAGEAEYVQHGEEGLIVIEIIRPEECEPPDCEGDPESCEEDPDDPGDEENDPDWTDPDNQLQDCIVYYNDYVIEGRQIDNSCYTDCWEMRLPDGSICEPLKNDDYESGCELSGGDETCQGGLIDYCARHRTSATCVDICENSAADRPEYCREACESEQYNLDSGLCRSICENSLEATPQYCSHACETGLYSFDSAPCARACRVANFEPEYCGRLCEENSTWRAQSGCWNRCTGANSPDDQYCQAFREREARRQREEEERQRREAEEELRRQREECESRGCEWSPGFGGGCSCPTGGGSGGGGDRPTPHSRVTLWIPHGGCYPYVGPAECYGSVSESNCTPTGSNQACEPEGICGCYTNGAENWVCCDPPGPTPPGYYQTVYTDEDCIIAEWIVLATCHCLTYYGPNESPGIRRAVCDICVPLGNVVNNTSYQCR